MNHPFGALYVTLATAARSPPSMIDECAVIDSRA